jgi:hypothetical protein
MTCLLWKVYHKLNGNAQSLIEFEYVLISSHQWMHLNDIELSDMVVRQVVSNQEQKATAMYRTNTFVRKKVVVFIG